MTTNEKECLWRFAGENIANSPILHIFLEFFSSSFAVASFDSQAHKKCCMQTFLLKRKYNYTQSLFFLSLLSLSLIFLCMLFAQPSKRINIKQLQQDNNEVGILMVPFNKCFKRELRLPQ